MLRIAFIKQWSGVIRIAIGVMVFFLALELIVVWWSGRWQEIAPVSRNEEWRPLTGVVHGVEMVLVPPGCFMMGSEGVTESTLPVHQQCFDRFFLMDRFEVTNQQYGEAGRYEGNHRPRESVSWFDALVHCESRLARLPAEVEWEYAARGPDNLLFPWGNEFMDDHAVDNRISAFGYRTETEDVGSMPDGRSWVGAMDMSGNVEEWISTIYAMDRRIFPYPYNEHDGREDLSTNDVTRGVRGGAFIYPARGLYTPVRSGHGPRNASYDWVGFRCARRP